MHRRGLYKNKSAYTRGYNHDQQRLNGANQPAMWETVDEAPMWMPVTIKLRCRSKLTDLGVVTRLLLRRTCQHYPG